MKCGGGRPSFSADLNGLLGMAGAGRPSAVWAISYDGFDSAIPAGLAKDRFSPEDHKRLYDVCCLLYTSDAADE